MDQVWVWPERPLARGRQSLGSAPHGVVTQDEPGPARNVRVPASAVRPGHPVGVSFRTARRQWEWSGYEYYCPGDDDRAALLSLGLDPDCPSWKTVEARLVAAGFGPSELKEMSGPVLVDRLRAKTQVVPAGAEDDPTAAVPQVRADAGKRQLVVLEIAVGSATNPVDVRKSEQGQIETGPGRPSPGALGAGGGGAAREEARDEAPVHKPDGWTKAELIAQANKDGTMLSPSTFDLIRQKAKLKGGPKGGRGPHHKYRTADLKQLIAEVEGGEYRKKAAIAEAWRELLAPSDPPANPN
ncbi:MAG: hypothetical protein IT431_07140 [Phycisphaerales bacterium]|nr:hypothetical protein [Phycisphaerales bacterium]